MTLIAEDWQHETDCTVSQIINNKLGSQLNIVHTYMENVGINF